MTIALIATLLGLGVGLGLGGAPNTKDAAAPRCTLALDAGAREDRALGGDSLRDALAEASGCEVGRERRAPTVLRVRVVGGRARLELRVRGRETLVRIVALDADPHERTQAIVIVATHMLRNEADELLGLLGRRGGGASEATPLAETQPPESASDAATATREPADTEASADVIATEPTASVIASEASAEVTATEASETRADVNVSESTVDVIATGHGGGDGDRSGHARRRGLAGARSADREARAHGPREQRSVRGGCGGHRDRRARDHRDADAVARARGA